MKAIKLLLITATAVFAFQSCKVTKNATKEQLEDKWVLNTINGKKASDSFSKKLPTITFDFEKGAISGTGGCNGFGGSFTYKDGEFTGSKIISTMMFCDGVDESSYFKLLDGTSHLTIANNNLIFLQDKKPVLIFDRAVPLSETDLAGKWELQSLNGKSISSEDVTKMPTLEFNFAENRLAGSAGCNNYNGTFSLSNNVLDVKPLAVTRMACLKMEVENEFIKAFTGAFNLEKEGNTLFLKKDNKTIMTFSK